MGKSTVFLLCLLFILLFIPAELCSSLAMPEMTFTRTHLMRDVEESSLVIGAGVDYCIPNDRYLGDILLAYCGGAPLDWLELGLGLHVWLGALVPSVDVKLDVVDLFGHSERFSLLLQGGVGITAAVEAVSYHAGAALNIRLSRSVQLYLGAGTDSLSDALVLQAGACLVPAQSLSIAVGLGMVTGPQGTAAMLSLAPLLVFQPGAGRLE